MTLILTFATLLFIILIVINWSFRQGFDDFLLQQDIARSEQIAQELALHYQYEGGWEVLRNNPRMWREILEPMAADIGSPLFDRPPGNAAAHPPPPPPGMAPPEKPRPRGQGPRSNHPPPKPYRTHNQSAAQAVPSYGAMAGTRDGAQSAKRPPPPSSFQPPPPRPQGERSQELGHRLLLTDPDKSVVFGPRRLTDVVQWVEVKQGKMTLGWLGILPLSLATESVASSFVEQQYKNVIWFSLLGLALILAVSIILARLFLRPVTRVAAAVAKVAQGDLAARVTVKGQDELAQLSADFNRMATKLEHNEILRKQWLSDISHELRTPIAILSGEIEALRDGLRQPTLERIQSLYHDVQDMSQLVDDLHQLSLADQGALVLDIADVDICALCREQVTLYELRMAEKGLNLRLQETRGQLASAPIKIAGDRRRLSQLVANLLENSLRYTDSGGETVIVLQRQQTHLKLTVYDSAPGVPDNALESIFQRLYRVDKSRSRSEGGSGLGLAICQSIVSGHGGTINATQSKTGGLAVVIMLPLT